MTSSLLAVGVVKKVCIFAEAFKVRQFIYRWGFSFVPLKVDLVSSISAESELVVGENIVKLA